LHELHDKEIGADIIENANVGVAYGSYCLGLPFKAIGEFLVYNFYRNEAVKARVACFVHLAHTTGPDAFKDAKMIGPIANRARHIFGNSVYPIGLPDGVRTGDSAARNSGRSCNYKSNVATFPYRTDIKRS
jgi:hypothetical protein